MTVLRSGALLSLLCAGAITAGCSNGAQVPETGAAPAPRGEPAAAVAGQTTATSSQAASGAPQARSVVINEVRLSDADLTRVEGAYRIRIPDANYWYDPVLGAWGAKGGPTMGLIAPGLPLGGPLQSNASNGNTGIFVNGRELPAPDVVALQQITGAIAPARYFITAQGLAGYEGGPPQWNLAAMAAQAANAGGSQTWQGRISSGFSDGTTSAVFLPNGGIVSTGQ